MAPSMDAVARGAALAGDLTDRSALRLSDVRRLVLAGRHQRHGRRGASAGAHPRIEVGESALGERAALRHRLGGG